MSLDKVIAKLQSHIEKTSKKEDNSPIQRPDIGRHSQKAKVKMSNALITATHGLNLTERRLIYLGMVLLKNGNQVQVTTKLFSEAFGVNEKVAYRDLKSACDKLFDREIRFTDGRKKTRARWVQSATYHDGEGWCSIQFTDVVCDNIKGLQAQYTRYALAQAGNLRSVFSWRLMERFLQYGNPKKRYKGWWEVSIEDLCRFLELSDFYKTWWRLKEKILLPATKELFEKDGWKVEIIAIKTGRKTTHVRFEFERDTQKKLDF